MTMRIQNNTSPTANNNMPSTGPTLAREIKKAAKDAAWVSETDSTPEFITTSKGFAGAMTAKKTMAAFAATIASEYDEQDGDLSNYAIESEDASEFWENVTTEEDPDALSSGTYASGWRTLEAAFKKNLTETSVFRVGPKDDDGSVAVDQGTYVYLVVGRTADNKLAGVTFVSAET